jgi:hypothetical protein
MLIRLGADAEELLLKYVDETADVTPTVNNIRTFMATTALNTSQHQFTLYSITQLAAYYVQRRQHPDQQLEDDQSEDVRNFALRLASEVQDSLIVAPFVQAAARVSTTPARRLLVLLAARTAVDAAVEHAAEAKKAVDAKVIVDVMNLLMSRDRVTDLRSLRFTCQLSRCGSFPVPSYPHLELPTEVLEAFVGGRGSWHVSFQSLLSAFALHKET